MLHRRANEARPADAKWHRTRERKRRTTFSPEESSDIERERYNLDSDDPLYPADITGEDNPETYGPVEDESGFSPGPYSHDHPLKDDGIR